MAISLCNVAIRHKRGLNIYKGIRIWTKHKGYVTAKYKIKTDIECLLLYNPESFFRFRGL